MLSENILTSNHADGVCFRSEDVSRQMQSRLWSWLLSM